MFSPLKKFIAMSLLIVMAYSCSGLSFGMIGHGFMQAGGGEHGSKAAHDCCSITDTDQGESSATTGVDYHTPTVATLPFIKLLGVLLIVFVVTALPEFAQRVLISLSRLYVKAWLERWSYFALQLKLLFSQGILHPKTW